MSDKYINKSQVLLMRVVRELAARPLQPRTLQSVCTALGEPRDAVFRTLETLRSADWARQHDGGWMPGPGITNVSEAVRIAIATAHRDYLAAGPGEVDEQS